MKCAVIMPIGPGHDMLALDASDSVSEAFKFAPGRFVEVNVKAIDDQQAKLGRSRARNIGVLEACKEGYDWIFFLDADDVMHPQAFSFASQFLQSHDAIWGAIYELATDEMGGIRREPQTAVVEGLGGLLSHDPHGLLQMGHFVRAGVASEFPFDEAMDAGEDWDYYVRVWAKYRCIKIAEPLFYNRRGMHAVGARAATGAQWNEAVRKVMCKACREHEFHADFTWQNESFRFFIDNPFDHIQRYYLRGSFFESTELEWLVSWVGLGKRIVEVGAYVGNHAIFYARFLKPASILILEPNPEVTELLSKNLIENIDKSVPIEFHQLAAGRDVSTFEIVSADPGNRGASYLKNSAAGNVRSARLDDIVKNGVDFIKIDAEGMELEVLEGATELIRRSRPKLMVEIMNDHESAFDQWLVERKYRKVREFRYVNAINVMAEALN